MNLHPIDLFLSGRNTGTQWFGDDATIADSSSVIWSLRAPSPCHHAAGVREALARHGSLIVRLSRRSEGTRSKRTSLRIDAPIL